MFTEDADVLKCGLFLKINRGPRTHDDSCCRAGFVLLWCVCSQDREDSSFFFSMTLVESMGVLTYEMRYLVSEN